MRTAALLITLCVSATVFGRAQSPGEFAGTLEPELTPGRVASSISMTPAPDDARAKVAAWLSADEKLWIGDLTVGAEKRPLYLVESAGDASAVMADLNGNGAVERDERIALARISEPPMVLGATIRVVTTGAPFPNYPVRVAMNHATIAPRAGWGAAPPQFYLSTSYQAFAVGRVTIDGLPVRVQLIANAKDFTVNPAKSYQYIDCDGDGEFNTDMTSWEMGYGSGEPVVFHLTHGDRYVSITRVDPAAKTITLAARAAADYQRIELRVGATLPDFAFTAMNGSARHLADFRGKYLIIDFWGTWCGPCVGEIPFLKKAYETYRDKGLEILGMDNELPDVTPADFAKGLEKVKAFIAERGITWTQAQTESIKPLYEKRFQIVAWPTVILLDPKGVVVSVDRTNRGEPGLRGDKLDQTLAAIFKDR
jgi:thiol-disulfide isomerase/thioredoxin